MDGNKMNILNRFFSRTTFSNCLTTGSDDVYQEVVKLYIKEFNNYTNMRITNEIYDILQKEYRNEYYYKNTLLNKLLLGVHSLNTTTALTELPIANSKADFILINGKAIVYEIKTELDNLERLEGQISDYYKAFSYVSVVTYKENVEAIKEKIAFLDKPVGIYFLKANGVISAIQKPEKNDNDLDQRVIFKLLRKQEYETVLLDFYSHLPSTSDFEYYGECQKLFMEIPLEKVYPKVLKQLKERYKVNRVEFYDIPYELKFLAYFMQLKDKDYKKMNSFLGKIYGGV